MTASEVLDLQTELTELGYAPGPIDGIYGPRTERAYRAYLDARPREPALVPTPAKPWYASSALLGAAVTIAGAAAGLAGWEFDAESAKELLPAAVTLLGGFLAWIGTIRRKAPIDPTLLARFGGHDLRLPGLRREPVPPDAGGRAEADSGRRRGPFDSEY
jgi:hypothetical protein